MTCTLWKTNAHDMARCEYDATGEFMRESALRGIRGLSFAMFVRQMKLKMNFTFYSPVHIITIYV